MAGRTVGRVADRAAGPAVVGAYKLGELLAQLAPRQVGDPVLSAAGHLAAFRGGDKRLIVERNLRRVYGRDLTRNELNSKVQATFESYARYYYDSFRLTGMSVDDVEAGFTVDGIEHIEAAMEEDGVGPVLALPHLGGWEWAAFWITQVRGWGLAAVVEKLEPPELFEWFLEFRTSLGMNIIPLSPTAADDVANAAANKEIVCLLCDRDLTGSGVPVSFFGEQTTLPAGPAIMALRGGCRVLPTAVYFTDKGVHGVVRPPIEIERTPDATSIRADVARFTEVLASELEALISRAPEQWHLLQPNWPSDFEALGIAPPTRG
ncbi:MAG: phosphatidylinositol mannoside acyltransferase [Acidimicrobiales bacterium]